MDNYTYRVWHRHSTVVADTKQHGFLDQATCQLQPSKPQPSPEILGIDNALAGLPVLCAFNRGIVNGQPSYEQ